MSDLRPRGGINTDSFYISCNGLQGTPGFNEYQLLVTKLPTWPWFYVTLFSVPILKYSQMSVAPSRREPILESETSANGQNLVLVW